MLKKPLVVVVNSSEGGKEKSKRIGILLMDVQGAFDNEACPRETNCLCSLAAETSDICMWNAEKGLDSRVFEQLEFFTEMVSIAGHVAEHQQSPTNSKKKNTKSNTPGEAVPAEGAEEAVSAEEKVPAEEAENDQESLLQGTRDLVLLVRDWAHFDDDTFFDMRSENNDDTGILKKHNLTLEEMAASGTEEEFLWSEKLCKAKMDLELQKFLKDPKRVEKLNARYPDDRLTSFMLPRPGEDVERSKVNRWDGDVRAIKKDFIRFIDLLFREKIVQRLRGSAVLGEKITPNNFKAKFESMIQALKSLPRELFDKGEETKARAMMIIYLAKTETVEYYWYLY